MARWEKGYGLVTGKRISDIGILLTIVEFIACILLIAVLIAAIPFAYAYKWARNWLRSRSELDGRRTTNINPR